MSDSAADEQGSMRRLMLALDALNCDPGLIDAAAVIAAKLGVDLDALFVEDADLYAVADLPITQEISLSSARTREISGHGVEQAVRCLSREAEAHFTAVVRRSRLQGQFQVTRARREQALSDASLQVDMLMLQPSSRTLLRVRVKQQQPTRVFVVAADTPVGRRALELGLRLALQDHHQLELISRGVFDTAVLAAATRGGVRLQVQEQAPQAELQSLLQQVDNRLGNILLLAADTVPAARGELLEMLTRLRCQVLLIN
jgi:hypothetical protein